MFMSPTRTSAVVSRKLNLGFKDGPNLTSRKKEHVLLKDVSGKLFFVCTAEFFFRNHFRHRIKDDQRGKN